MVIAVIATLLLCQALASIAADRCAQKNVAQLLGFAVPEYQPWPSPRYPLGHVTFAGQGPVSWVLAVHATPAVLTATVWVVIVLFADPSRATWLASIVPTAHSLLRLSPIAFGNSTKTPVLAAAQLAGFEGAGLLAFAGMLCVVAMDIGLGLLAWYS